jgi:hypothetical protein
VLLGDYNLDWSKKEQPGYALSSYFDELDFFLGSEVVLVKTVVED